jgi:transketolase
MLEPNQIKLDERSKSLRKTIIKIVESGRRGHVPSALSLVEILRVLYDDIMHYDAKNPKWDERDRFILSKGHGCLALYTILAEKGFFPESELWRFCKFDALLGGHPEHKVPGIECSTGSLGHGLSIGVGFALNARLEKKDKKDKKDHRVFVVIGDGEMNEGSVWEAALSAGKHKLDNLVVLVDYNKCQSYGKTCEVLELEPLADKWRSFGFEVLEVNGHDVSQLRSALSKLPLEQKKPSLIICHTVKGKGIKFLENNYPWHHKAKVSDEEIKAMYSDLEKA